MFEYLFYCIDLCLETKGDRICLENVLNVVAMYTRLTPIAEIADALWSKIPDNFGALL